MKAATDFFLDISVEFVTASLKKTNQQEFCFKMSLIVNTHGKKKGLTNDIIDLIIAMGYHSNLSHNRVGSVGKLGVLNPV